MALYLSTPTIAPLFAVGRPHFLLRRDFSILSKALPRLAGPLRPALTALASRTRKDRTGLKFYDCTHTVSQSNQPIAHASHANRIDTSPVMSHPFKGQLSSSTRHSGHKPSHVHDEPKESGCRSVQPRRFASFFVCIPIPASQFPLHISEKVHREHAMVVTSAAGRSVHHPHVQPVCPSHFHRRSQFSQ